MGRWRPRLLAGTALVVAVGWLTLVPAGSAGAQAGQPWRAYVVSNARDAVSVINTGTGAVAATIDVGHSPIGIQLTPDARTGYVANNGSGTVSVIDTARDVVTTTIGVGAGPAFVAISPDGSRAYVTDNQANTVSVINTATNLVIATIPVGDKPIGVAVSPDGRSILVADNGAGTVSVINAASNRVTTTIDVGTGPTDIAFSPDGRRAYLTENGDGTVSVINTAADLVVATVPVGDKPIGVAVSPDGTKVYAGNSGADTVSVIDAASGAVKQTVPGNSGPFGLATTPDGALVYVAGANSTAVTVIGAGGTGSIEVGAVPTGVAITPDQAPVARLAIRPAPAGNPSTLDASASTVEFGTIASYRWDFGDGSTATTTKPVVAHRYPTPGDYPATVTLTSSGRTSTSLVFSGRTVSRNGGPQAVTRATVAIPAGIPGTVTDPPVALAATGSDGRTVTAFGALGLAAGIALLLFGRGKPRATGSAPGRRYTGRHIR